MAEAEAKYRWAHPIEWLQDFIDRQRGNERSELEALAKQLASLLDGDQIQDLFQAEMDADGYFNADPPEEHTIMSFTDTRRIGRKPSRRTFAKIDRQIEAIFYRHCAGVSIKILDIGKVFEAGRAAALAGADVEAAIVAAVAALAVQS